jgi:hypothetical protein
MPSARPVGVLAAALSLAVVSVLAQGLSFTFDDDATGMPPRGFLFSAARQASAGTWEVRGLGPQHHLAHLADSTAQGFSIATPTAPAPPNLLVVARIRLVDGDRRGGIVWRYRDANNFYLVGISLQRHEAMLHRIMGGNRVQLDRLADLDVDPGTWHTLGVAHEGDQIRVHLDGIAILHARDRAFDDGGRAGVWSGGAAETWFDDIRISAFPEPRR